MQLITLSGVDGSGKSTQLALLKEYLEQHGNKVAYFHAIEFGVADHVRRFFRREKTFVPGSTKAVTEASWFSLLLRNLFLFLDLLRFRWHLACLRQRGYDVLLSDRYFYDTLINIAYLWKKASTASFFFERLIPKPDFSFYFDVSPEAVLARERAPEQGFDYLKKKIALFKAQAVAWNFITLDANQAKETVFATLLKALDQ